MWWAALACKTAFLAYVVFLMVFSFWRYLFSKIISMACVAFKLPFHRVGGFQARFHDGHYPSFKCHSVLLLSCFHSIIHFQVVFRAWVVFKLVCLACVAFRLFSQSVWPSSWTFLACLFHSSLLGSFIFCSPFSFIACVAYKLFSWRVLPSSCVGDNCGCQVSAFLALHAFRHVF